MSGAAPDGARRGGPLRSVETLWEAAKEIQTAVPTSDAVRGEGSAAILLVDHGAATTNVTLVAGPPAQHVVGGMTIPRGGSPEAVGALLAAATLTTRERETARDMKIYRGGSADVPRAARTIASALQLPVVVIDIGTSAGRIAAAAPDRSDLTLELDAAALSPRQAIERRRRAVIGRAHV